MASTRLPGKPLADIHGEAMIVHVWRRAIEADVGPVLVACAEQEIAEVIANVGGEAVLTTADLPSGSDRIWQALQRSGHEDADIIINLQGDLPTIGAEIVHSVLSPLVDPDVDIATLAAEIVDPAERDEASVNKAVISMAPGDAGGRALYFTKYPAPWGAGPVYHHVGIYAFRRDALARFVALPPGHLEQREKLEQLRALENGMRIDVRVIDSIPIGVDTPADLEKARQLLAPSS